MLGALHVVLGAFCMAFDVLFPAADSRGGVSRALLGARRLGTGRRRGLCKWQELAHGKGVRLLQHGASARHGVGGDIGCDCRIGHVAGRCDDGHRGPPVSNGAFPSRVRGHCCFPVSVHIFSNMYYFTKKDKPIRALRHWSGIRFCLGVC